MLKLVILASVITVAYTTAAIVSPHPLSDDFIDHINSKQSTWKAGRNFPPHTSLRNLVGAHPKPEGISLRTIKHDAKLIYRLPRNFDPRMKWPHCPSLNEIRDQGACGSCWAFGAVTAMTDRICINSTGQKHFHVSAEDLLTCCNICGDCQGGVIEYAWLFWHENGIVSGGNYNSRQGCKPYPFPSRKTVLHPSHASGMIDDNEIMMIKKPKCVRKCDNKYMSYNKDKFSGQKPYNLRSEDDIKAELFINGPVEASFQVYEDFFQYERGVYIHTAGEEIYGHAVRILGWGVERGVKYWLAANSWSRGWGDNGFFKILRGVDHLGIESRVMAGMPDIY